MLAIRLQRIGRKGHSVYRVAVQEAQRHPSSGRVVTYVGSFDPHSKTVKLDTEKIGFYLNNGAKPSPRVVNLLQAEKVALPSWVNVPKGTNKRATRNPEKLRKNQPKEEPAEAVAANEQPAAEAEEATPQEA